MRARPDPPGAAICRAYTVRLVSQPDAFTVQFPSATSASRHLKEVFKFYAPIGTVAGTKFWYRGLRNRFITVAERKLPLPRSLTWRLVNHSRGTDVTKDPAADWTVEQLREPARRVANRIESFRGMAERSELLERTLWISQAASAPRSQRSAPPPGRAPISSSPARCATRRCRPWWQDRLDRPE